MAAIVFGLDLMLPLGVAEAVPYVAVVLISVWSPQKRDTLSVALICTILTGLGFFLSPEGAKLWIVLANRAEALFAIWITAILAMQIKKSDVTVREQSQMLTGILSNMPAVAFRMDEQGYTVHSIGKGLRRIGLKHYEVAGRTGLEPPKDVRAELEKASPGETVFYESHGSHQGSPWWFLSGITADTVEGKGAIGFGLDITDRKRIERRIAAHHAVAHVLTEATSFRQSAPQLLQAICENLGWAVGAIWNVDHQNNMLRCTEIWHPPQAEVAAFTARTKESTFARGVGLPGRVWESGQPAWIEDVVEDPNFPRAPVAAEEGIHAGFSFPIRTSTQLYGVMEFFSREIQEPDQDLLKMFAAIGSEIGLFIERKRAEQRLAAHHAVTMVLAEAQSFADASPQILQAICKNLDWEMGAIWKINQARNVLECAEVWQTPQARASAFESKSLELTLARGIGLPGRVWESGTPAWITDVVQDPNFPRAPLAEREGLHAGFCFPIPVSGKVFAVMEFFSHEIQEPDKDLLQMFAAIGTQIGQFIEHTQT